MNDFTPLVQPLQSRVTVDPTAKECPSDGFNYPVFRQLNKQARLQLSQRFNPNPSVTYWLFAIANSKGWFAAVQTSPTGCDLIFSTLEVLRSAFLAAKDDERSLFSPKRTLTIPSANANIIAFTSGDTRLLVGLENGLLAVYDTATLFTPGTGEVSPLKMAQVQSSSLRQIVPNPGTEPNLSELFAVVGDGKVALLNVQLEPQGGWAASDLMTQPISVAWSPKGKHIAIGLQTGDILTFSLANKSTPNKHIPPTSDAVLVSLNWLGPGHTFRTSYAAQDGAPAKQYIITLDAKTSTATYVAPDHPFSAYDRNQQSAYVLSLPKWDEDSPSSDEGKSLTIVGDFSSVDLEILGNIGTKWFRQSQDNPLTLPLDRAMDDTILLALEVDLTDAVAGAPIIYAYLNDGTLQGWHAEHSKRYVGMLTPGSSSSTLQTPMQAQESKDTDMALESAAPTPPAVSSFSSFGQPAPAFGGGQQTSVFGKTGFGQTQGTSAFGQSSFSQLAFGQTSLGAFGQTNQTNNSTTSAIPSTKPASGFGAFAGSSSSAFGSGGFGSQTANPFGGSAFSSTQTSHTFGQSNFRNAPAPTTTTTSNTLSPSVSPTITQEASMSDDTPGFGGLSLGSAPSTDSKAVNSMFGTFGSPSTASGQTEPSSTFGGVGLVKPATGFGAFGGLTSGAFDPDNKPASSVNAFGSPTTKISSGFGQTGFTQPAFGQTAFGSTGFGKPAFGQSAFGKTGFGATPATTATQTTSSGGFGAFASAPNSLASAAAQGKPSAFSSTESKPAASTGFSAFASAAPAPFGSTTLAPSTSSPESKPASAGFAAFASGTPLAFSSTSKPATETSSKPSSSTGFASFTSSTPTALASVTEAPKPTTSTVTRTSVLGTALDASSSNTSPFGTLASDVKANETPAKQPAMSPPSSPEPALAGSPFSLATSTTPSGPPPPVVGGAFTNLQTTPSSFKPAAGFGAFGSTTPTDSPFFKKPEQTPPVVSAFAPISPSPSTKTSAPTTTTLAFGSPSILGAAKSPFTPTTPTPTKTITTGGAFASFSGSSSSFASFSAPKKSFSDLLKTGGEESRDPEKPSTSSTPTKDEKGKVEESKQPPQTRTSVFGTLKADETEPIPASAPITKDGAVASVDKGKSRALDTGADGSSLSLETSSSNISLSSTSSSYVDVEEEPSGAKDNGEEDENQDASDFLTDDELVGEEVSSEDGSIPEEEDEEEELVTPSPTAVPLPASRSTSATPQPEVPKIEVSDDDKASKSSAREQSTTPPGTPREVKTSHVGPVPSTSSAFGIGLGRPSTRPTRRSPLANAVVLEEEAKEEKGDTISTEAEEGSSPSTKPSQAPTLPSVAIKGAGSLPTPPSVTPPALGLKSPPPEVLAQKPLVSALSFNLGLGSRPATAPPDSASSISAISTVPVARAATAPATPSPLQTGLFAPRLTNVPAPTATPIAFDAPTFSFGAAASPAPLPTPATKSIFGTPTMMPPAMGTFPTKGLVPPATTGQGLFGKGLPQSQAQTSTFLPSGSKPVVSVAPPAKTEEEILEEGMQKECINLVKAVEKAMEEFRFTAANARHMLTTLNVALGGSNQKADLGNPAKWGLADVARFGEVLLQYEGDLGLLEMNREKERQALREIKNSILKAGTRREEIARFNKAKDDKDFAKLLKARSLGPEQSETQMQLRKGIRAIRNRVQILEKRLQDDKKRLAEAQSCKPRVKPPSLDTINRTYRNIGVAIEQQTDEVNRLATRISKINIASSASGTNRSLLPQRDSRLPDLPASRKPPNVTPNVAVTTAAALNAERSAQRLKKALLTVRKEPLLNRMAVTAPTAPHAYNSPKKPQAGVAAGSGTIKGFQSLQGPLFSAPTLKAPELGVADFDLPEDHFDPIGSHGSGNGRREKLKRSHRGGGSVIRKSPAPESSASPEPSGTAATATFTNPSSNTVPVSFDWGPLPAFANPSTPKGLPKAFVPISSSPSPAGSVPTGASGSPPTTLELPKGLPKGFVSFAPLPSTTTTPPPAPSILPVSPPVNLPKGFVSFTSSTPRGPTSTSTFSFAQHK